jgi:hypothetical protein
VENNSANIGIQPGALVTVVYYLAERPVVLAATVSNESPQILEPCDSLQEPNTDPRRAMLIVRNGDGFLKAEAEIEWFGSGEDWKIHLSSFSWEEVDRRRFPRHEIRLDVRMRAVTDDGGTAEIVHLEAKTVDLSLGGAWIETTRPVPAGTLVEFLAQLAGNEQIRVLGIVAHSADGVPGFGVEFLDYMGAARFELHKFLSQAA